MKIKILQVVGQMTIGGQEMMALNFFKYIDRDKFDFDYLVFGDNIGELEIEVLKLGGNIFHIDGRNEVGTKNFKNNLYTFMQNNGPYHVIHSHTYLNSGIVLEEAKKLNIPVRICHCHSTQSGRDEDLKYRGYRYLMTKKIMKYATHLMSCGIEAGKSFYGDDIFTKQGLIIKNGIDLNKFRYNKVIRDEVRKKLNIEKMIVLGSVSRVTDLKNQIYLLEVAKKLKNKISDFCFLIVGDGPALELLKKSSEEAELSEHFIFLGARDDIADILQAMDIFVHPSKYEGVPVCIVEAETAGLPCIISSHVSREVKMLPNIAFVDIRDEDAELWANKIVEFSRLERKDEMDIIVKYGYDIVQSCLLLSEIYEGNN